MIPPSVVGTISWWPERIEGDMVTRLPSARTLPMRDTFQPWILDAMDPAERTSVSVERLMALDPFADLDHHDLTMLARWVREVRVPAGSALVEQGDLPYDLFVIESGSAVVVRDDRVLATLGPGDLVGEMAVLRGQRRMATVRASDDVTAVAVAATDLAAMTEEMPEVVRAMHALTQERAANNDDA